MVLHCDEEDLALMALGEPASAEDEAHLQQCSRCSSRLDQLSAVVSSARAITDADRPVAPPPAVWAAIAAEVGASGVGAADATVASVTPLTRARSRRTSLWLVAAAAAVVGLVAGGVVTAGMLGTTDQPTVVATTSLDPIADSGFAGTAAIEDGASGPLLRVSVPDLPQVPDGYYEVWMATPDTATMVAIGTLNPGQDATFALPSGMDASAFPVVDVSVEHFDGNAGHSAVSVVRGQFSA